MRYLLFYLFQLPLSGSQNVRVEDVRFVYHDFQLPLSGSLIIATAAVVLLAHFQLPLSGSLTRRVGNSDPLPTRKVFQLPLSGSLSFRRRRLALRWPGFQLPLSGSLKGDGPQALAQLGRAFNSLSRDHILFFPRSQGISSLSTPSLGITRKSSPRQFPTHGMDFQLPLSGSPSPIPGFSVSPRLSAAAPLRTNDF